MKRLRLIVALLAMAAALATGRPGQAQIVYSGSLSNFDVWNNTGSYTNDFEICMAGILPADIDHTWTNPNYTAAIYQSGPNSTCIVYTAVPFYITPDGTYEHFGVVFKDPKKQALHTDLTWTQDGIPVDTGIGPLMIEPSWTIDPNCLLISVLRNNLIGRQRQTLWVQRRINVIPGGVRLEDLMIDSPVYQNGTLIDDVPVPILPREQIRFVFDPCNTLRTGFVMMYEVYARNDAGGFVLTGTMLSGINSNVN